MCIRDREYAVGAATVSISWSRYLIKFLEGFDVHLPVALTVGPWDGGMINLPAVFIVVLMSLLLMKGTQESALVNGIIVALKVTVVIVFIILGWKYINESNYTPYIQMCIRDRCSTVEQITESIFFSSF